MSANLLSVTLTFTEENVMEILAGSNKFRDEEVWQEITVDELRDTPALRKYLEEELQEAKREIIYGSYDATANDWLCDIADHRKKKYRV